jgi:predicted nucleic acid-binding protein
VIVADASAAVAALTIDGLARERLGRVSVHAPHLIDYEVASALRRRVLSGDITEDGGRRALTQWSKIGLERYPARGLLARIWELQPHLTAYAAAYAALAEALGCPLVTADRRLAMAPGTRCEIQVVPR